MRTEKEIIEEAVYDILKPFIYRKYGKTYIGYYETEGALRYEGMEKQIIKIIKKVIKEINISK